MRVPSSQASSTADELKTQHEAMDDKRSNGEVPSNFFS